MPGIAENALESTRFGLRDDQRVLANIETTAVCGFTPVCGDRCILNIVNASAGAPLVAEAVLAESHELIASNYSNRVRHLAIAGKEPLASPEVFFAILRQWHAMPESRRPGTIGLITADAPALKMLSSRFTDTPVSWVNISIDTDAVGLRTPANATPLLENALYLRRTGGTLAVGVNTLLSSTNLEHLIAIGRRLQSIGIDQWSIGPFLFPCNGRMESQVGSSDLLRALDRLTLEFGTSPMRIVFEVDHAQLFNLAGTNAQLGAFDNAWRYEYRFHPNVTVIATNPREGYFVRARWDGALLGKQDFRTVGLKEGQYGRYAPGRIAELLGRFAALHKLSTPAAVA